MTSLSRRKRPTTARPTTPSRTAIRLAGLAWLLWGGVVAAQQPAGDLVPPPPPPKPKAVPVSAVAPPQTLYFNKEAAPAPKPAVVAPVAVPAPAKPAAAPALRAAV